MTKIKYSKDVDALLIVLSDKKIDYAEDKGNIIIHYTSENEPVLLEIYDAKEFIQNSLASILNEKENIMNEKNL